MTSGCRDFPGIPFESSRRCRIICYRARDSELPVFVFAPAIDKGYFFVGVGRGRERFF